jgi:argininosuccinate synthase
VTGQVSLKLYKGNVISLGKESANSLYDENKASFEEQGGFSNEDMKNHIERNILDFDA